MASWCTTDFFRRQPYAADIHEGRHRSHPRHWQVLANLAGVVPVAPNRRNAIFNHDCLTLCLGAVGHHRTSSCDSFH